MVTETDTLLKACSSEILTITAGNGKEFIGSREINGGNQRHEYGHEPFLPELQPSRQ